MLNRFPREINRQLALAIQLNDEATLADFCWDNNSLLQHQLMRSLTGTGEQLIYLWGGVGCGKSHLLQACCQAISNNAAAIYLPLRLLKEWGPASIEGLSEQALLAIDDVDAITTDKDWEEALFHLYNKVHDNGKTILLISSNQPPSLLNIRLPDLKSRLGSSLVVQLNELNDDLKIKTLQQHAIKRGFTLPTSVGQFLINRCARNMHDLHHILDSLDKASLAAQRKITVPFVKALFGI